MSLVVGTRLGPYEIQSAIGAGGMGEVYKGRDTRLDRTVAIKVLPPDVSGDPERRARFEREAKAIAGLNHAHICVLHDVGDHDGAMFLVMEHLTGQTLEERLQKGPLPLEQALTVATEIAEALSAAHRQGVVHRDLKPGNVMLAKGGAKLLDFGLAKLTGHGEEPAATYAVSAVPTQAATLTGQGVIVGTLQYMAPEQLEGKPADARTDLWAFGAILYEMVTGKRAFAGTSAVSLMTAIMSAEPTPIAALQPLTPPALDRIVRHCLEKDPAERFQSARDVVFALANLLVSGTPSVPRAGSAWRWPVLAATAAVALLAGGVTGRFTWPRAVTASPSPVVRSSLIVGDTPGSGAPEDIAISPDGRTVVFVATAGGQPRLYARRLDDVAARALPGTEGALGACFSPDSNWIAFMTRTGLSRVKLSGGPAVSIAKDRLPFHTGMEWGEDGNIIFARGSRAPGLWRVPAKGGPIEQYRKGEKSGVVYYWPRRLPGSEVLLFTRYRSGKGEVAILRPGSSVPETVLPSGAHAQYLPATGHLVYKDEGNLLAVRFDSRRLVTEGEPFAVVPDVGNSLAVAGEFDVSRDGTLVHLAPATARLAWRSRDGSVRPVGVEKTGILGFVALSPDGRRAVVTLQNAGAVQLWLADQLDAGGVLTRLTPGNFDWFGLFTPDGRRLLFTSAGDDDRFNIYTKPMDRNAPPERQTNSPNLHRATSVAHQGTFLFNNVNVANGSSDVWEQKLDQPSTARPLLDSPASESEAAFSPDGRWIAYVSDISGAPEVYVQQYPNGAPQVVSVDGGGCPIWSRSGDEVFYQQSTSVFAVRVLNGARVGSPTKLFDRPAGRDRNWDASVDGTRFLVAESIRPRHIQIVTNWSEQLKTKVPPAR